MRGKPLDKALRHLYTITTVHNRSLCIMADQRPICFSNPAVQREEAGTAAIRQISTLCCHPPTAASGEPNYCIEG